MTIAEKLIAALQIKGSRIVEYNTTHYTVLTRLDNSEELPFYFVGKRGALRTGKTIATSVATPNRAKRLLQEE